MVKKITWYDLPQIFEMFWILEEGVMRASRLMRGFKTAKKMGQIVPSYFLTITKFGKATDKKKMKNGTERSQNNKTFTGDKRR